jgi:hypothetical protein
MTHETPLRSHFDPEVGDEDDDAPIAPFDPANETRDLHDGTKDAPDEDDELPKGPGPKLLKHLLIQEGLQSDVWDFRASTQPNGGRISLRACVHHIPVIRDQKGKSDLELLRKVLMDQGLMVQFGTDREGNVAMYTEADRLCFHARGGNSVTCGIEHMHFGIGDPWTEKQFRAAAWVVQLLEHKHGLPMRMAQVESDGPGRVKIVRTGHTTHEQISNHAGFFDRKDAGPGFEFDKVFAAASFFQKHGHFVGC